jgi:hypothetical protein
MTKRTKTYPLTDQQRAAITVLIEGGSVAAAATAANVDVGTLRESMRRDPAFRAELNAQRHEAWNASANRLRQLVPAALDVLQDTMGGPQRLQAALAILKAAGLGSLNAPGGLIDPADIEANDEEQAYLKALTRLHP